MSAAPSPSLVERLRERFDAVYGRVEAARTRSPRAAPRVRVVAVTKGSPVGVFDAMVALGEHDVGENRVADAATRRAGAPAGLVWHGIGHLQTNKVKKAVATFDVFHALDSLDLARALDAALRAAGRTWPVYAQVNAAGDPRKGGVGPDEAAAFLAALEDLPQLAVVGLMTMAEAPTAGTPKAGTDPGDRPVEAARRGFGLLRTLRDEALARGVGRVPCEGLSMGMSDDFEVAVEEGATVVRVGRALFADSPGSSAPAGRSARKVVRAGTVEAPRS